MLNKSVQKPSIYVTSEMVHVAITPKIFPCVRHSMTFYVYDMIQPQPEQLADEK